MTDYQTFKNKAKHKKDQLIRHIRSPKKLHDGSFLELSDYALTNFARAACSFFKLSIKRKCRSSPSSLVLVSVKP